MISEPFNIQNHDLEPSEDSELTVPEGSRLYVPRGKAQLMMHDGEEEILMSGPAGTGKTRACLEKVHVICELYPGARVLVARKTRKSMQQSTMVTFREKVLPVGYGVVYVGQPYDEFRYPNGSVVVLSGLDDPEKIKSAEFDMAFINEATEVDVNDWELVSSRLRNGVVPWAGQLLADCNPAGPKHWLRQRCLAGLTRMYESRHEDNPALWAVQSPESRVQSRDSVTQDSGPKTQDRAGGEWTEAGRAYIGKLERLTGARLKRLRYGIWAASEGMVYEGWDPDRHVVDRFEAPSEWRRFVSIDFGYNNPFVAQWWALSHDGVLYRYREIYVTKRLVMDLAPRILELSRGERIEAVICDHDAEDRATMERLGVRNVRARKNVSAGIQAVAARLAPAASSKFSVLSFELSSANSELKTQNSKLGEAPRLFFMRDSLVAAEEGSSERDPELEEAKRPCCTEEEPEGYVWQQNADRTWNQERPVDENNHGLDSARYMVAHLDLVDNEVQRRGRSLLKF